jgi:hypothetical protein
MTKYKKTSCMHCHKENAPTVPMVEQAPTAPSCSQCGASAIPDERGVHECKKENIESLRELKRDCKQCPQCTIWISKIDGCNQMFCTECITPFDWTTCKVIKRTFFHNPHYNDYLNRGGKSIFEDPASRSRECHADNFSLIITKPRHVSMSEYKTFIHFVTLLRKLQAQHELCDETQLVLFILADVIKTINKQWIDMVDGVKLLESFFKTVVTSPVRRR